MSQDWGFTTASFHNFAWKKKHYKREVLRLKARKMTCLWVRSRLGVTLTVIKPIYAANYLLLWTVRQLNCKIELFNFEPWCTLSNVNLFCFCEILTKKTYPVRLNPSSVVTVDDVHEAESTRQVVEDKFTHYVTFSNSRAINYHNTLLKRQWNSSIKIGI